MAGASGMFMLDKGQVFESFALKPGLFVGDGRVMTQNDYWAGHTASQLESALVFIQATLGGKDLGNKLNKGFVRLGSRSRQGS